MTIKPIAGGYSRCPRRTLVRTAAAISLFLACSDAAPAAEDRSGAVAAIAGLALQANEGGSLPSEATLRSYLPPGQTVRDVLGWQRVESARGVYAMPDSNWRLYTLVSSVGGKNVVTLFSGNRAYGMEKFGFPENDDQRQGFADFAAWAVRNDGPGKPNGHAANIPNLYAVTIWNEMNGSWHGDIRKPDDRAAAMAALLSRVVPAIRASNPSVRIAAGAFVGFPGLADWFQKIGRGFDWHSVDWLDIHPYLADLKEKPAEVWAHQLELLRAGNPAAGIPPIRNPAYYSEWGGPAAVKYARAHADDPSAPSYFEWFESNVLRADPVPVAGGDFFTLFSSPEFPRQGLAEEKADAPEGSQATPAGGAFRARYLKP